MFWRIGARSVGAESPADFNRGAQGAVGHHMGAGEEQERRRRSQSLHGDAGSQGAGQLSDPGAQIE